MEPRVEIIAAVDKNWAIGYRNQLLVSIPLDQRLFREETMGNVVIMGRKTLESLPAGKPLEGRWNLVLSRKEGYRVPGAEVVHSEEALFQALEAHSKKGRRIFVAGGGQIYRMLLPYAEVAHITRIWNGYEADTYFPDLDQDPQWVLAESGEEQTYFDLEYRFCRYERTVPGLQPDRNKTGACGV